MFEKIKQYVKPSLINIGLPLAVWALLGVPISGGCSWESKQESKPTKGLEQVVNTVEQTKPSKPTNISVSEAQEFAYYASLYNQVEDLKGLLNDYSGNVYSYSNFGGKEVINYHKIRYLVRAEQSMISLGERLHYLQQEAKFMFPEDEELQDKLLKAKRRNFEAIHSINGHLYSIFEIDKVKFIPMDVEILKNATAGYVEDSVHNKLWDVSKYLMRKLDLYRENYGLSQR